MALLAAGPALAGTVDQKDFGTTRDGKAVHIFTLTNNKGMRAQVLDYGGIICDVEAPGRDGKMANVILCQKDMANILATGPMSALTGRYAADSSEFDLTASVGWTWGHADTAEDLIRKADIDMYRQKARLHQSGGLAQDEPQP